MKEEIYQCIEVLKSGGLILYPTDTVWGIGCDATNDEAVNKIYELKQRLSSKSLIVLVSNDGMLNKYVKNVPDLAWDIIDISDKPTTIIYNDANDLAQNVTADDNSIAVRLVKEGFANQLIYNFRKPIVSTSANISNTITPLTFSQISSEIKDQVGFIVNQKFDTGNNKPSSLIKLSVNGDVEILRK